MDKKEKKSLKAKKDNANLSNALRKNLNRRKVARNQKVEKSTTDE